MDRKHRNNDCVVENEEEIWTETFTRTNLHEYLEIPGPKVTLERTKTELDFLNLLFPLDLCTWITNKNQSLCNSMSSCERT